MFFWLVLIHSLLILRGFSQNGCLGFDSSDSSCTFCAWGYYDQAYYEKQTSNYSSGKRINSSDCVQGDPLLILSRRVLISNAGLSSDSNLIQFQAIYSDFIDGLLRETQFLMGHNVTKSMIYLTKGTHFHYP